MGAISKSVPILMKLNTHHFRPNSLLCAKFPANQKILRDFGAQFTLNRTKIYMGTISKSEPMFTKPSTPRSRPNSLGYAKFHANRKINIDFDSPFTLNRMELYMGVKF